MSIEAGDLRRVRGLDRSLFALDARHIGARGYAAPAVEGLVLVSQDDADVVGVASADLRQALDSRPAC